MLTTFLILCLLHLPLYPKLIYILIICLQNDTSYYDMEMVFECLKCPEGCDTCEDDRPCVVSLNWLMRSAILILQCTIILMLPIVGLFTFKYSDVKVKNLIYCITKFEKMYEWKFLWIWEWRKFNSRFGLLLLVSIQLLQWKVKFAFRNLPYTDGS